MSVNLNEKMLTAYIKQAINEELEERFLGIPSRRDLNNKWGYEWDKNLSAKQNRRLRDVNKAQIKAAGYKNYDEYMAGEEPIEEPETDYGQDNTEMEQIPQEYPYKANKQKTGQFQTWFNLPPEKGGMGGNLVVDGIWGPKTEAAYQQWVSQQGE